MVLVVQMKKIAGMLRVKNEARWIECVLRSILPVCELIYVFDDHSDDGTQQICRSLGKVVLFESPFDGLNETRDKNWLLEKVEETGANWVLHIDGDEEVAPGGCQLIRDLVESRTYPEAYRFQVLYLWNRPNQIRVDRWYADYRRGSLFHLRPGARFHSVNGGGFHCGNVPEPVSLGDCDVKLLHYGYMLREDRIYKYNWYNAPNKQPVPEIEDGYRHMILGDLLPADTVTRWAGPLKLQELNL